VPRLLVTIFCALLSYVAAAAESTLRPATHEDLWLMNRVGTPVVSPDGRYAVVDITEPSYEEDGSVSDLWLIQIDGDAAPRHLTSTPEPEGGVEWSPDGTKIAFHTMRGDDEFNQVYVLSMDGPGEAVRVTSLSTGASNAKWSPDGTRLAFESLVYPGTSDDAANVAERKVRDERKYNVSVYETFPVRQWDRWRDDQQTRLFVQDARNGSVAADLLAGSDLVAAAGYGGVESRSGDSLVAAWTPDSQALIISATANLDEAAHAPTKYHLYKVSAAGGAVEQLTDSDEWSCEQAMFSNDGDAIYCLLEPINEHLYNLTEIARFDWSDQNFSNNPEIITASFDRSVTRMDLSANGRKIFLTAYDAGRSRVYSLSSRGGEAKLLNENSRGAYTGVKVADRFLVARWESSEVPAEIVRVSPSSGKHVALTNFNTKRASQLDRQAFREFWFESSRGRQVHSWIALPPGFDESQKYPLVLLIHGGPFATTLDAEHIRWSPHLLASAGYVVLMTDYTGSVGYGVEFSRNIKGDPLRTPGEELVEAADEAIRRYSFIDPERQAAAGASYGGHLINWLQGTTTRFKALIGHAGLVDLEGQYSSSDTIYHREIMNGGPAWENTSTWQEQSPSSYVGNFSTPILLTIGEKDFRVPVNQTIAAWSYVQRMQVPGKLLVFHDANHWIMKGEEARYYWQQVHEWLARYLGEDD